MKQVVTEQPIAWERDPLPFTLLGDADATQGGGSLEHSQWVNYSVAVEAWVDPRQAAQPAPTGQANALFNQGLFGTLIF